MPSRPSRPRLGHVITIALVMLACLKATLADLLCTQSGTNTFRVGSTLKFQWNDTQTVEIDSFSLHLYCVENSKLIMPNIVPNLSTLTSPSPVSWVVPNDIAAHSSECKLNQYYAAFVWPSTDPETGAAKEDMARCMTLLFNNPNSPGTGNSGGSGDPNGLDEDPESAPQEPSNVDENGNIIVSDQTKSIVIGVGCAVGVLVLSGIVGFYVIRYRNKRAVEKEQSHKLREPMQKGPIFPPSSSSSNSSGRSSPSDGVSGGRGDGHAGMIAATAHTARVGQKRYNELSSNVSTSDHGDQFSNHRHSHTAEMSELGGGGMTPMTVTHTTVMVPPPARTTTPPPPTSPSLSFSSRPSTPIAAQHAKLFRTGEHNRDNSGTFSPTMTYPLGQLQPGTGAGDRPVSVLTSSFVPIEDEPDRRKKQQQQQQYELQTQLQQQQQQQMQQYMNYGSY
ncbi:hypothetical protein BGZ73_001519 [Actinomortierella ambigua]|nr:hypothetical protein BGZ73_001519 [Actinomortierella ambigua]